MSGNPPKQNCLSKRCCLGDPIPIWSWTKLSESYSEQFNAEIFSLCILYHRCLKIKTRDRSPKFATALKCLNRHRSKSIWVTFLFFCQNDSLMAGGINLAKGQLGHYYTFWTMPITIFSPVSNLSDQSQCIFLIEAFPNSSQFCSNCWYLHTSFPKIPSTRT